jgi:phosphomannomutase
MAEQCVCGIAEGGADVLDIGLVATELVYWTVARRTSAGLVCTSSHNPKR